MLLPQALPLLRGQSAEVREPEAEASDCFGTGAAAHSCRNPRCGAQVPAVSSCLDALHPLLELGDGGVVAADQCLVAEPPLLEVGDVPEVSRAALAERLLDSGKLDPLVLGNAGSAELPHDAAKLCSLRLLPMPGDLLDATATAEPGVGATGLEWLIAAKANALRKLTPLLAEAGSTACLAFTSEAALAVGG